jgi:hypothetical protein
MSAFLRDGARGDVEFGQSFGAIPRALGGAASDALGGKRCGFIVGATDLDCLGDGVQPCIEVLLHRAHLGL